MSLLMYVCTGHRTGVCISFTMVRRRHANKVACDNDGNEISFQEIAQGTTLVYTAWVDNMVSREIPVSPLFALFGKSSVIKADFDAAKNECMLTVFQGDTYAHTGGMVVTYQDLRRVIDTHTRGGGGGECVDAAICGSYTHPKELALIPLVYEWKALPMLTKCFRGTLCGLVIGLVVYLFKDSPVKEVVYLAALMFKDALITAVSLM